MTPRQRRKTSSSWSTQLRKDSRQTRLIKRTSSCLQGALWRSTEQGKKRKKRQKKSFPVGDDHYYYYIRYKSMSDFLLKTDANQISSITSMRVMVSAALLFVLTIHYMFIAVVHVFNKDVKIERMYDHGRRLVLYGIAALLSISFLNYGIYHAILAWLILICMLIIHSMAVIVEIKQNFQNIAITIYYILIGVWFFGILFFYMFNALS